MVLAPLDSRNLAEQDYLLARQALQEAEIALNNARQKMTALSGSAVPAGGNRYELRAPFAGVVVEKHLGVGEVVSETSNAFTLSDLSQVWVTFGVFPKDLNKVRVGKPVKVSSTEMGTEVLGTVAYVGNLLGEQTRTATVRVTVPNALTVQVRMRREKPEDLVVRRRVRTTMMDVDVGCPEFDQSGPGGTLAWSGAFVVVNHALKQIRGHR